MKKFTSVNDYIEGAPEEARGKLRELRALIKEVAPEAVESISYGMPGYKLNGPLVYFAGYKKYIGFYPTSAKIEGLEKYRTGKGTLQFPINQPLPLDLIRKAVKFRVKQNLK